MLSGDVPQRKRETLLGRFVRGELNMLVATDVAARGLHIPAVSHVFNYDLPLDPEDYVHRIGRTARLGAEGDAISFACDEYAMGLPDIEQFIEQKIPVAQFDPSLLMPVPRGRAPGAEGGEMSVVEDALREASEERRKRRERDQRDGRRGDSRGPRSGDGRSRGEGRSRSSAEGASRETRPERTENPQMPPRTEATRRPEPAVAEAGQGSEEQRRRRRRSRGRGRGPEQADASGTATTPQGTERPTGEKRGRPSLGARLKSTIKSWFRRLGMPRTQR